MPIRARAVPATTVAASLLLTCAAASAQRRDSSPPSIYLDSFDVPRSQGAGTFVGFEPPEFQPGPIVGQGGWNNLQLASADMHVSAANPDTGVQHLRLIDNPAVPDISISAVNSPMYSTLEEAGFSFRYSINNTQPGPNGGARYEATAGDIVSGFVLARVQFEFDGSIRVLDRTPNAVFVDTGADWVVGGGYHTIQVSFSSGQLQYLHDGALIYTSLDGVFSTSANLIQIRQDHFHHPNETGDFDTMLITGTPEPSAVGTLAMAAVLAALGRRGRSIRRKELR